MLSCKDVSNRASALIDGETGLCETLRIRLHLAMCKGCSAFVAQMRVTRDLTGWAAMADFAGEGRDFSANPEMAAQVSALLARFHDETQTGR